MNDSYTFSGRATAIILILAIPFVILEGFLFSIMWGWFVVPLGLPAIKLAQSVGILVMLSAFKIKVNPTGGRSNQLPDRQAAIIFLSRIILMFMLFFVCFVVHCFM